MGIIGSIRKRLAAYWAEALGGPSNYTNSMGDLMIRAADEFVQHV